MTHRFRYFTDNIIIVLGVVLVWRSVWYLLDAVDLYIFGGNHIVTVIPWFVLGMLLLYLPDHDLKELGKL